MRPFIVKNGKLEDLLPDVPWSEVQQSLKAARTSRFQHFIRWLRHAWVTRYHRSQPRHESSEVVLRVRGAQMLESYESVHGNGPKLQDMPSI